MTHATDLFPLTWMPTTVTPADLETYGAAPAEVGGVRVALYAVDDQFYATADLCTHGHGSLSEGFLDGEIVECPLHQGLFNVKTGEAVGAPCTVAVKTYPVKLQDGALHVALRLGEDGAP